MFGSNQAKYTYFCNSVIPLLGVYPTETGVYVPQNSTRMFIVALFIMSEKAETTNVHQQNRIFFFGMCVQ